MIPAPDIPILVVDLQEMDALSLQGKIAFFAKLDALDSISDREDEVDEQEQRHRDKCRAFFRSRKRAKPTQEHTPSQPASRPRRTASEPSPAANSKIIEGTPDTRALAATRTGHLLKGTTCASFVEDTPVPETARPPPPSLRRSTTLPLPPFSATADQSPSTNPALRKRKRQSSTKSVSAAPRIFDGLFFYYIPDNDIAPARRLRISRAWEHGAQRVRELSTASHVIVDKHLNYKDIEGVLGSHPIESLVIVNEDYPIDCMSFRTLLNPNQNRYKIPGWPIEKQATDGRPPPSCQTSDGSLQVKTPLNSRKQDTSPTRESLFLGTGTGNVRQKEIVTNKPSTANLDRPSGREAEIPPSGQRGHKDVPTSSTGERQLRRRSSTKDELSEYIQLIQEFKDLPLDTEEDDDLQSVRDNQEVVSESERDESSEEERARKSSAIRTRRAAQKTIAFDNRFACNRGGTEANAADAQSPNARTIEVLQSMCDYYNRIDDHWRTLAYRKAIATLRRQPTKIMTEEEAYRLANIGRRLAAKIEEIVTTNKLRRLEYANEEPIDQVLETFLKIYDVGTSRANKWIAQGFRTLDDLRQKADLTPNQRIGIEHYDDLNTRIPRAEVAALFAYVQREARQLDPAVELLVGGSYRRGSDSSGDVDIIVTKKGTSSSAELVPFLEELVAVLTRKGFLVATLAALHTHRPGKDGPGSKWHGCCVLPDDEGEGRSSGGQEDRSGESPRRRIWRRIDFLLVPESEYGAALIYFTGNDIFNRSMRLLASKKGMKLNQRGLYGNVMRGKGRVKATEGELLEGRDEKRIFELLGVKWREPWERWC
ncbi:hypothetical protein VTK26DRAFT_1229 [Humicola hyalothermophila]